MDSFDQDVERQLANRQRLSKLDGDVAEALQRAIASGELIALLSRIAHEAPDGSDESLFANGALAELVVERHPWRAAVYARKVLTHRPNDERCWATMALCHTMLGNYRSAVHAYRMALGISPSNPWYAHNIGHLFDVALNDPPSAIRWLRLAYARAPWSGEVVLSFAHALARSNKVRDAQRLVARYHGSNMPQELPSFLSWLEAGAPPISPQIDGRRPELRSQPSEPPIQLRATMSDDGPPQSPVRREVRRKSITSTPTLPNDLEVTLAQGLRRLPFSDGQRAHAIALARDAKLSPFVHDESSKIPLVAKANHLAAAIAYAIVFVDRLPLSQAEVASTFRTSVSSVRHAFCELRSQLDLTPGDVRYRSVHRR